MIKYQVIEAKVLKRLMLMSQSCKRDYPTVDAGKTVLITPRSLVLKLYQVFKWWFHENPPATLADREDFMTWVFKNPDEACQIIFEVTGGKEK